ncbi:MAG: TetR/AcrR family transcriptional regulator [Acidimicrobiia bacterium]
MGEAATAASPRARRREDTRREILEAAWALCRRNGLAGLSLRELAASVGLRAPSLYSYFPSKDAIYDALFAEGQHALAAHLAGHPEEDVSRADVHRGARAFFDFCTADPVRYQLLFQRTLPGFEPSRESYGLAVSALSRVQRQLAAAGADRAEHVDLFTALITGLIDQQISNDPGGDRWARLLGPAVDMFCDHAGIPADPAPRRSRRAT